MLPSFQLFLLFRIVDELPHQSGSICTFSILVQEPPLMNNRSQAQGKMKEREVKLIPPKNQMEIVMRYIIH